MAKGLPRKSPSAAQLAREAAEPGPCSLDIQLDERDGLLRIYDPRAFHDGRRAFCRRLIEAVAEQPGFEKAEIDLANATCLLRFDPRSATERSMADALTAAVHRAAANRAGADRGRWWHRPSRWTILTAFRGPDGVSWWETLEARPGRIQLRHEDASGERSRLSDLSPALESLDGIDAAHVSTWSRTLTIDLRPDSPIAHRLPDAVEQALRESKALVPSNGELVAHDARTDAGGIRLATGYRRLRYLALAGGSFTLTLVGLVVPGIPTVPFLLATSYYLARSSPRLNDRLRRTALFGPILVEWEQYHGLSRASKAKLITLTAAIVVVTLAVGASSPAVVAVILVIALFSATGIARLPGIPGEVPVALGPGRSRRLALPPG